MSRFLRRPTTRSSTPRTSSSSTTSSSCFAVTQISHLLLDDLTWSGAGKAPLVLLVVWWAWNYTTWVTNVLDPDAVAGPAPRARDHVREPRDGRRDPRRVRRPRAAVRRRVRRDPDRPPRLPHVRRRGPRLPGARAGAPHPDLVLRRRRVLDRGRARVGGPPQIALWLVALAIDYSAPLFLYRVPGRPKLEPLGVGRRDVALRRAVPAVRHHRARRVDRRHRRDDVRADARRRPPRRLRGRVPDRPPRSGGSTSATSPRSRSGGSSSPPTGRRWRATATRSCTSFSSPGIIVSAVGDEIVIAHPTETLPTRRSSSRSSPARSSTSSAMSSSDR